MQGIGRLAARWGGTFKIMPTACPDRDQRGRDFGCLRRSDALAAASAVRPQTSACSRRPAQHRPLKLTIYLSCTAPLSCPTVRRRTARLPRLANARALRRASRTDREMKLGEYCCQRVSASKSVLRSGLLSGQVGIEYCLRVPAGFQPRGDVDDRHRRTCSMADHHRTALCHLASAGPPATDGARAQLMRSRGEQLSLPSGGL